jgi:hypothetical protein
LAHITKSKLNLKWQFTSNGKVIEAFLPSSASSHAVHSQTLEILGELGRDCQIFRQFFRQFFSLQLKIKLKANEVSRQLKALSQKQKKQEVTRAHISTQIMLLLPHQKPNCA